MTDFLLQCEYPALRVFTAVAWVWTFATTLFLGAFVLAKIMAALVRRMIQLHKTRDTFLRALARESIERTAAEARDRERLKNAIQKAK